MPEHTGLVSDSDITRLVNFVNKMTANVDGCGDGLPRAVATALLQATIPAQVSISCLHALLRSWLDSTRTLDGTHVPDLGYSCNPFCLP